MYSNTQVYYPYACVVCLKSDPNIKRCSNCKVAAYCSKEHQDADWRLQHKRLCKVMTACDKKFCPDMVDFSDWSYCRLAHQLLIRTHMKRKLTGQETSMSHFRPICAVCFSRENLRCCESCLNVSYCSEAHKLQHSEKHQLHCESFKIALLTDQFINFNGLSEVEFCTVDQKPLTRTEDILKYIKLCDVPSGYKDLLTSSPIFDVIKLERMGLGLNLLNCINRTKISKDKFVIHIVGASTLEVETNWSVVTQIIMNWTNISYITYYIIGPDLRKHKIQDQTYNNYEIHYYPCLYHEIYYATDKPNLIAAFHCAFHEHENEESDPWERSIPKLLHFPNIPLMLTAFTETELVRDKAIIDKLGFKLDVIADIEKNPFPFLKPFRDWGCQEEPIFYRCNYILIVKNTE